jgi:hypothetical protein
MKKITGVIIILLTLLLTVIYRQLAGSRVKDKPGHACKLKPGYAGKLKQEHSCALFRLREEMPLFQLLIQ